LISINKAIGSIMVPLKALRLLTLLGVSALFAAQANSAVVRISEAAFVAGAGLITFSEKPIGTVNPVYTAAQYGGGVGSPTVSFGGFFAGQALGTAGTCPAGAALTGCVVGNPTSVLSLAAGAPNAFITTDSAFPSSPTLSGTPRFNGPIGILFDTDQAGVGLQAGFFDAIGGTAITAFARDGTIIGQVVNLALGIEFLGLVTSDNTNAIAGLLFSLVGAEPQGFNIDNVRFGVAGQVVNPGPQVPLPGSLALLGIGALGLLSLRKKAR
jgi:PEP-CTERM motif